VNRHVHGFQCADALQDRFGPAMRLLTHLLYCLLISGRNDIGGPKYLPQVQPRFLVADEKDENRSSLVMGERCRNRRSPSAFSYLKAYHRAFCGNDQQGEHLCSPCVCRTREAERKVPACVAIPLFYGIGKCSIACSYTGCASPLRLVTATLTPPHLGRRGLTT
jgi:hypothetical protein